MTRISTICAVNGTLAVLAFSADSARFNFAQIISIDWGKREASSRKGGTASSWQLADLRLVLER